MTAAPVEAPPLLIRRKHLAKMLGRSIPSIDRDIAAGRIPPPRKKLGGTLVWVRSEILDWVNAGMPTPE